MPPPLEIINFYYKPGSRLYEIFMKHAVSVAEKALAVAQNLKHLSPDMEFIQEAAMLHDIGIFLTDTPSLYCYGEHPYVCHGYLGRSLLKKEGMIRHALVCERHVGVGITADDVRKFRLPLPEKDALPVSIEEQIICYADKFFSKTLHKNGASYSLPEVLKRLERYGPEKVDQFMRWESQFNPAPADHENQKRHRRVEPKTDGLLRYE